MGEYDPRWGDAIASIESGGSKTPYQLMGPATSSGDRAHGKYQVMGANIPEWTNAALGRSLTPSEFLSDPSAQDAVFKHRFGGYADKYGNPQDAASAWFTGGPQSTGGNKKDVLGTSGNVYVDKFNRAMDGPTAIQAAMGGRSKATPMDDTGALSYAANNPGVLSPNGMPQAAPQSQAAKWGQILQNMSVGLGSISNPAQGQVLAAAAAANRKDPANTGTWSMGAVDPTTGIGVMTNSHTGQQITKQIHAPKPEKDPAGQAYDTDTAKAYAAKNQSIADSAVSSHAALSNLDTLRTALTNPDVYQGTGGETVAMLKKAGNGLGMDFQGVNDADVAKSLINKLTQESRQLNGGMPGSLSDKDLSFLKAANAGLDKTPEANQRIIDIYAKLHKRNIDMNTDRLAYTADGKHLDEGFTRQLSEKWAGQKAAEDAADKAAPAPAAPAAGLKLPKGVKSIQIIQ